MTGKAPTNGRPLPHAVKVIHDETPRYTSEAIAEWVAASRAAQGLPPVIEDPTILQKIADIIARHHAADSQEGDG